MNRPVYLGDGVYADDDGFQIKIICDCMSEPNAIYLEPKVFSALVGYAKTMGLYKPKKIGDGNEQTS